MENLAYKLEEYQDIYQDERPTELLDGIIFAMSSPGTNHVIAGVNIIKILGNYLAGKGCKLFYDHDLHLTKRDRVRPDVMVVCRQDIIKGNGIHGAPDLVVEILSRSTKKRDRGYKLGLYERCGIREYWIVDTRSRAIEVYLLIEGKLTLDGAYEVYFDHELEYMEEEERAEIPYEFKTSLFDDLVIKLEDIFQDMI